MRRLLPIAAAAFVLLGVISACRAQEDISQELPPPASVAQGVTPIERSFLPRLLPPRLALFPRLREVLRTAPPFFSDIELDVNVWSYYRNRETSYDFTRAGIPGLTFYGLFAHGWTRVSPSTKAPVPNEHEVDVDVQSRPQRGFLNGAWFRARYGRAQQYRARGT